MDDWVPLYPASATSVRGPIGQEACVHRRGPVPDDDHHGLLTAEMAESPEAANLLKWKSDVPMALALFLADLSVPGVPSTAECLRSGNGTEVVKPEFVELRDRRGVGREDTPVGFPKNEGVVERPSAVTLDLAIVSCLGASHLSGDSKMLSTGPLEAEACHYRYASDMLKLRRSRVSRTCTRR